MAPKRGVILRDTHCHTKVEWELLNFFNRSSHKLQSTTFLFSDADWYLEIYPTGDGAIDSCEWISLYLCKTRRPKPNDQHVAFFLGIKAGGTNFGGFNYEHTFTNQETGYGSRKFMERSELYEFMSSEYCSLTVICTIDFPDARYKEAACQTSGTKELHLEAAPLTSRSESVASLSKDFEQLFIGRNFSDIKVKVGEREFDAHRVVLAARSPVFTAMFQHEMRESNSGVVEIPDMDPESAHDFLFYLYTGQIESRDKVTCANAINLYKAADKYAVKDLKQKCILRLTTELSVDSVLDVILFAVSYSEVKILGKSVEYFLDNAEEIFMTEKWELFNDQHGPLAKELIIELAKRSKTGRRKN